MYGLQEVPQLSQSLLGSRLQESVFSLFSMATDLPEEIIFESGAKQKLVHINDLVSTPHLSVDALAGHNRKFHFQKRASRSWSLVFSSLFSPLYNLFI